MEPNWLYPDAEYLKRLDARTKHTALAMQWNRHRLVSNLALFVGDGWLGSDNWDGCPHCDYPHAFMFVGGKFSPALMGTCVYECLRCGANWTRGDEEDGFGP
jgi:hypothetical protein